jgi:peptide deformylase
MDKTLNQIINERINKDLDYYTYEPEKFDILEELLKNGLDKYPGLGISATQLGIKKRACYIKFGDEENGRELFLLNPVITQRSNDGFIFYEGCLSIPKIRENVIRKEKLVITYFDENWNFHEESYDGYAARIIQHEYDHIEGILFTDHLSSLKRKLLTKRLNNITTGNISVEYRMRFPETKKSKLI